MTRGLFDFAAPLFDGLDRVMIAANVPEVLRVMLIAIAFAFISMWLYRRISNQEKLSKTRAEIAAAQKELATYDGEFAGLRGLITRTMTLTFRQVALTGFPALIASIPLLFALPWLSNRYSEELPGTGEATALCISGWNAPVTLEWQPSASVTDNGESCFYVRWPAESETLSLAGTDRVWIQLPLRAPSPVLHKKSAFNWLFANPAGYVDDQAPFEAVHFTLRQHDLIDFGPSWVRHWMFAFFGTLIVMSLIIKVRWKVV
jgi:uncharacterized membrane protein (DUF106 family)